MAILNESLIDPMGSNETHASGKKRFRHSWRKPRITHLNSQLVEQN